MSKRVLCVLSPKSRNYVCTSKFILIAQSPSARTRAIERARASAMRCDGSVHQMWGTPLWHDHYTSKHYTGDMCAEMAYDGALGLSPSTIKKTTNHQPPSHRTHKAGKINTLRHSAAPAQTHTLVVVVVVVGTQSECVLCVCV